MGTVTKSTTLVDGTVPTAAQFNGDFDTIYSEFNGNVDNANIKALAGILESKLAFNASTGHSHNGTDSKLIPSDGWNLTTTTLTYSSVDGHIFVVTTSADLTASIGAGDRIKFTNNSTTFYGIVNAISATTITIYGGTDYTVANSAITAVSYSHHKSPFGFTTNPDKWTESLTDATRRTQSSPVSGTWYNLNTNLLAIPIGLWNVDYSICLSANNNQSVVTSQYVTLSTANNSETDPDMTAAYGNPPSPNQTDATVARSKIISLAIKTTYYLNTKADQSITSILYLNDFSKMVLRARSAYL